MGNTIVEFKNVMKQYGQGEAIQLANNDVNFTIDEGEFVVILGQSGAGKSTVLNMLGGMDTPTSGTITVAGQEVSKMNDKELSEYRAGTIGFIFQFYNLLPSLTAIENVSLVKNIVKSGPDPMEMLQAVGLGDHAKKFPSQMSGGEQQRVAIARAVSHKPKIIFADEPTGALDTATGLGIIKLFKELIEKEGITIVMTTHDPNLMVFGDAVYEMEDGELRYVPAEQ